MACSKLAACLLNISEARNHLIEEVAKAGIVKVFSKIEQEEYIETYLKDKNDHEFCHSQVSGKLKNVDIIKSARVDLFGTSYNSQTRILNIFSDPIYNRSVITIAGTLPGVEKGVAQACIKAFQSLKG